MAGSTESEQPLSSANTVIIKICTNVTTASLRCWRGVVVTIIHNVSSDRPSLCPTRAVNEKNQSLQHFVFFFSSSLKNLPGGHQEHERRVVLYDQGEGHHQIITSRKEIEMQIEISFGDYL